MLQEHVHHYQNQANELKRENKELENCDRRLCVGVNVKVPEKSSLRLVETSFLLMAIT